MNFAELLKKLLGHVFTEIRNVHRTVALYGSHRSKSNRKTPFD